MRTLHTRILAGVVALGALAAVAACTASASVGTNDTTCAQDSTVTCTDGAGYSCTGGDTPDHSDSTLVCSYGEPGNAGSTIFCCLQPAATGSTTCGPDSTVTGCPAGSFGFSCADANEPPQNAYPELTCGSGIPGNAGSELYCCTDGTQQQQGEDSGTEDTGTNSCAPDSNVVCDGGAGFSCLGSDVPQQAGSCSVYQSDDAGISEYCCTG